MGFGTSSVTDHVGVLSGVTVDELCREDWPSLEKCRLEALDEAPTAFVTTVDAECERSSDYWEAHFDRATWVLARDQDLIVGIAALVQPGADDPASCLFVESVWVVPRYRWRGVLRQIMEDLEQRARAAGASELRLWVLDTNESAMWAYQKLGFSLLVDEDKDTAKPGANGAFVKERLMSRQLL